MNVHVKKLYINNISNNDNNINENNNSNNIINETPDKHFPAESSYKSKDSKNTEHHHIS